MNPTRWPYQAFRAAALVLAVTGNASTARADDSVAAQALFDQAKKAMTAHDFTEACPKLEESYRLDPAIGTLLNLADCYERIGRLATAWSKFLDLASKARAAGQTERARIGRERAAALAPRLSNLIIQAPAADRTPGLEVRRDGTLVGQAEWGAPIPADPGPHTVAASAPGRRPWSRSLDVGDHAATLTVVVPELAPTAPEPNAAEPSRPTSTPAPQVSESSTGTPEGDHPRRGLGAHRILALVSGGIGVAGVGVGTYFGLHSIAKHSTVSSECMPTTCPSQALVTASNDARTAGDVSTVAFIVGGAGIAGALALWFTAPSPEGSRVAFDLGPATIRLRGVW